MDFNDRLEFNFKKFAHDGELSRENFGDVIIEEVLESAYKKTHDVTLQRWQDLMEIGVLDEVWNACFGESHSVNFEEFVEKAFEGNGEKSEAEKLLDLCSEDEALRNQVNDLEQCLQSNKDMLATTDILLEEQMEKTKEREELLAKQEKDLQAFRQQVKELESLKTKVKNMESEHRLLKRDFDLVFATNKSVQKKMERAELENRSLRKTIITLAGQMDKIERNATDQPVTTPVITAPIQAPEIIQQAQPVNAYVPQQEGEHVVNWNLNNQPHMVWDPSVRSLVPITGNVKYRKPHNGHQVHNQGQQNPCMQQRKRHKKKQWQPNDAAYSNGRLINRFPRRYTSSHLPRYRRKYEMTEYNRFEQNKL